MYTPLPFNEYREHLFTKCGWQRWSSGLKIHAAYQEHCRLMRFMNEKYPA